MTRLAQRFPRYSKLLYLYPAAYRQQYGEQMLQTLADMLDDSARNRMAVWIRTTVDFPLSVLTQQVIYTGESMASTTPIYIKRTALVGAWLITPFFVFVALDSFMHDRLQHSWVWHTQALLMWLVILPGVAALLNLAALLRWVHDRRQESHQSTWKALTDVRHSWPLLGVIIVALGIVGLTFFHDSVHCVTGNPIRVLHNPHQTFRCIQQGTPPRNK